MRRQESILYLRQSEKRQWQWVTQMRRPRQRDSDIICTAHVSPLPIPPPFHARRKLKPFVTKQLLLISPAACCCQDHAGDNGQKCSELARPRDLLCAASSLGSEEAAAVWTAGPGMPGPPRPGAGLSRRLIVYSVTSGSRWPRVPAAGLTSLQRGHWSPVSQSLSTRQDYSLLSSLTAIAVSSVSPQSLSLIPLPSSVTVPRLRFLHHQHSDSSSAGFKTPSLRPFRNLGNNCNAEEEKGRESLCRKSVLNSQLHRVQQRNSVTQAWANCHFLQRQGRACILHRAFRDLNSTLKKWYSIKNRMQPGIKKLI